MGYAEDLLGPSDARALLDRHNREVSIADEIAIERRRDALIAEWVDTRMDELRSFMDPSDDDSDLARMMRNSKGMRIEMIKAYGFHLPPNVEGFMQAWSNMERRMNQVAHVMWAEAATKQAEEEHAEGEL